MAMKINYLIVSYRTVLSITTTVQLLTSPVVWKCFNTCCITALTIYLFGYLDFKNITDNHGGSSANSDSSSSSGDDEHIILYPIAIAAGLIILIIIGIVIIGIIVIVVKRRQSSRQLQQTAVATVSQASTVYPSTSIQPPPAYNQPYYNPGYIQQQAPQLSTGKEAMFTSVIPQPAMHYPFYHGVENTAVGSTSNPSVLPDISEAQSFAAESPPHGAYDGEYSSDESATNLVTLDDNTPLLSSSDYAN